MIRLIHTRTGTTLASRIEIARNLFSRMRGLLGREALPAGGGMLIERCASIHTFFMRFPIDALFVDSQLTVVRTVRHLGPWRLAAALGASACVELPAGALDDADVRPGDVLALEDVP